jgi:hypothetical protein
VAWPLAARAQQARTGAFLCAPAPSPHVGAPVSWRAELGGHVHKHRVLLTRNRWRELQTPQSLKWNDGFDGSAIR